MSPFPVFPPVRALQRKISQSGLLDRNVVTYEKCRLDTEYPEFLYQTCMLSVIALFSGFIAGTAYVMLTHQTMPIGILIVTTSGLLASGTVFYGRLWSVKSLKDYRSALIDASAVHATGMMLAMASFNVPLKRVFQNLANLADVYGEEIALEAAYVLALIDEDGMGIVSALRKAQSTSPSLLWQELLIGISAVQSGGGSLKEYLGHRYSSLCEKKMMDMRRYNETVQGMASIYLSVVGISSIFVAILNLVFNMSGMIAGDTFVWIDALVIVPLGSFVIARALRAAYPEV